MLYSFETGSRGTIAACYQKVVRGDLALFQWIAHRRYRARTWLHVRVLLHTTDPRELKRLSGHYPGILPTIANNFYEGERPEHTAILIAATLLSDQIEKDVTPERRYRVIEQLRRLGGGLTIPQQDDCTVLVRHVCITANHWKKLGRIERQVHDFMIDHIMGALAGQPIGERGRQRPKKIFHNHLMPSNLTVSKLPK